MSQSETPRTDALASTVSVISNKAKVPADFARQLERELQQARAALQDCMPFVTDPDISRWAREALAQPVKETGG